MSAWARLSSGARRRPLLTAGLTLAALLVLALAAAYAALQTQAGRDALARFIEDRLTEPGVRAVELGRIEGHLPHDIRLGRLTVADRDGVWLSIHDIRLDWNPLALFRGTLSVGQLSAEQAVVTRRPAPGDGADAAGTSGIALPVDVAVDLVALRSLRLEAPVLGEAASLQLEASASVTDGTVVAALAASRTDESAGRADLSLSYDAASRFLDLEASLSEPEGGLIARLAGLPGYPALALSVRGEGPPGAWNGTLQASAESLLSLESDINVALDEGIAVALDGTMTPGAELPEAARRALEPESRFAVEIARPRDTDRLEVPLLRLASGIFTAQGSARMDTAERTVDGTLSLTVTDASPFHAFMAPLRAAAASAEIAFEGPLAYPALGVRATMTDVALDTVTAASLLIDMQASPDGPLDGDDPSVELRGRVETSGFASRLTSLDPLLGGSPSAQVDATYRVSGQRFDVARLSVRGADARATASGGFGVATLDVDAAGTLEIDDMAALSDIAGRQLGGSAAVDYTLDWSRGSDLILDLSGSLSEPEAGMPFAEALLGPNVTVSGRLTRPAEGGLTVRDIELAGRAVEASGDLSLPAGNAAILASYAATLTDLTPFGLAGVADRDGRFEASGEVSGPPDDPAVEGTATFTDISRGGIAFERLALRYEVSNAVSAPAGRVGIDGTGPLATDLEASFEFSREGESVRIDGLQARIRETTLDGELRIPAATGLPVSGRLALAASDLARWSDIAGVDLSGRAEATVRLASEDGRQSARIDADARTVGLATAASIESVVIGGRIRQLETTVQAEMTATAEGIAAAGGELSKVSAAFDGTLEDAALSMRAQGEFHGTLDLVANGRMRHGDDGTRITLSRFEGEAAGAAIALRRPATIGIGAVTELQDLALEIDEGELTADFRMSADRVRLEAQASAIPVGLLAPDLPARFRSGTVDASLDLDGPPTGPGGRFTLTSSRLAAGEAGVSPDGIAVDIDGTLRDGVLAATGRMTGLESAGADLEVSVPVRVSVSPFQAALVEDRPARGRVAYQGPIGPAWTLAGIDRHRLSGMADIDLQFAGTLAEPAIDGRVALGDGHYENLETGTVLSQMEVVARPSASAIVIERASARDGGDGTIAASGRVDFGGDELVTLDLSAHFREALLIRRDELIASISGNLSLTGSTADRLVSGQLRVDEAEIRLVGGLPPNVVDLDVVEKGKGTAPTESRAVAAPSRTRLDVRIDMPRRIFVRGRGLDSEWGGELTVRGTTATPLVEGELRPVRGRYDFVGKFFTLRQGSITFTGEEEVNPSLDLSAERERDDLTAIIRVAGTARRPKISIESMPALPQDEVLSRVLFNKGTGRLSAAEALRLSQAIAMLSGVSDGGGMMDFARGMLNLDVLQFGGGDGEDGTTAQAGKYLSDKIYLGVEAGTEAGSSGATVEVEVTPNLKIEGDISGDEKSEFGIKWKRDY